MEDEINFMPDERPVFKNKEEYINYFDDKEEYWPCAPDVMMETDESILWGF